MRIRIPVRVSVCAPNHHFFLSLLLVFGLLTFPAQRLWGVNCSVVKHGAPSDAEKALMAGDYAKAEELFRAAVSAHPEDTDALVGLVRTLLLEQKVLDADEAVHAAQGSVDATKATAQTGARAATLLTLKGEVLLREGKPWEVEKTVLDSYKLDSCNPLTRLLFAKFAEVNSRYATARQQIDLAHQFDPEDPQIRAAWIHTLPLPQRTTEMGSFLAAPIGEDPNSLLQMKAELERWKKQDAEPSRVCRLTSAEMSAEIPFIKLLGYAGHTRASGLEMTVNSTQARLQLGAGQGGLTVYRPVAERAGLKRLSEIETAASPGGKPTYTAYADSIKLGNLEFHNCTVNVIDASSPFDDGDGNLDIDVFSDFLLTVDYPMRKLSLAPLPVRPSQASAEKPSLHTDRNADAEIANPQATDRYIAPEMKDYTQIYRAGKSLILPAVLTGEKAKDPASAPIKLFILDLGTPETNVSFGVAFDVSKVHEQNSAYGSGKIKVADEITYNFAHMAQKVNGVVTTDTSMVSKENGMEISGFFGANTFQLLIMHVDYRDGLLKFEYIPNRGYKFE
jgi:tetratricopeptide (TPR) repeat protein